MTLGGSHPLSSGPLAAPHAFIASDCTECHAPASRSPFVPARWRQSFAIKKQITDAACLHCHQVAVHHTNESEPPRCISCHTEHHGAIDLRATSDRGCLSCHSDLHTTTASANLINITAGFGKGHPEFKPLREHEADPGRIHFSHAAHMDPAGVLGPKGRTYMQCADCHSTAPAAQTWKFGSAQWRYAPGAPYMQRIASRFPQHESVVAQSQALVPPPSYANTCQGCHQLQFDPAMPQSAPHDSPQSVRSAIRMTLTAFIAAHPEKLREPINTGGRIPRNASPEFARSAADWVQRRAAIDENLLWTKTCAYCHEMQNDGSGLPKVQASGLKQRWLPDSPFSHYTHQSITCEQCHTQAAASKSASDVLIPSIRTCENCHSSHAEQVAQGAADARCSTCHTYHGDTPARGTIAALQQPKQ